MSTVTGRGVVIRELNKFSLEDLVMHTHSIYYFPDALCQTFLPPATGEVRVKVKACGVCQSDVGVMVGKMAQRLPCLLGHEGAGVIESIGDGVAPPWKLGDHVVLVFVAMCGKCEYCVSG